MQHNSTALGPRIDVELHNGSPEGSLLYSFPNLAISTPWPDVVNKDDKDRANYYECTGKPGKTCQGYYSEPNSKITSGEYAICGYDVK
jgi:hypothetical protein